MTNGMARTERCRNRARTTITARVIREMVVVVIVVVVVVVYVAFRCFRDLPLSFPFYSLCNSELLHCYLSIINKGPLCCCGYI